MAPVKSGNSWKNLLLLTSGNERLLDEEDIDFGSDVYALAESPRAKQQNITALYLTGTCRRQTTDDNWN